jgi:uncharacterized protein YfkK (UPF0435 family)
MMIYPGVNKQNCEYLRNQAKQKFDKIRGTWLECGRWALPHRIKWMLSQTEGERNNMHVVDVTHILALRSYVAGFLEGNTSATRPWYRIGIGEPTIDMSQENHEWLDTFTRRTLKALSSSNFYHAAGEFYYDFGTFNTGCHYVEEVQKGLFFHTLTPGSYYLLNNGYGDAVVMVRELSLTVKALVDTYAVKKPNGSWDWSNFSSRVKKMYDDGNYTQMIDIVHIVKENNEFNPEEPVAGMNKAWLEVTYELGGTGGQYYADGMEFGAANPDPHEKDTYLKIAARKRKPFIAGKSSTSGNYEYGEKGPTLDALGVIKSLNKKAIGKDQALEQMLKPPLQGPANLKKSYITTAPNSYVPLDPTSLSQKGLRTIYEVNPAIAPLIQDVTDLRQQVDRLYYADYLLYLSKNPKTRTATETNAIVNEQQMVIGPNLQSLNWTYNVPVVDYVMDYVLDNDPFLPPPPADLTGRFLSPEFISVFAQAQKAADLPAIDRYMAMIANVGQLQPDIWYKANLDKLADLYEDRLYLPAGLNNPQDKADALREQAMAQRQRQQQIEQMAQLAGAAKDVGLQANNAKGE